MFISHMGDKSILISILHLITAGVLGGTNPEVGNLQCSQYAITTAKGFWCGVGQGVINWIK